METYVQVTEGLSLRTSYDHYMTVKLLVHAGINHELALYYTCFSTPCMRNTGNLVVFFGSIFMGGSSLPTSLTAPNLTLN